MAGGGAGEWRPVAATSCSSASSSGGGCSGDQFSPLHSSSSSSTAITTTTTTTGDACVKGEEYDEVVEAHRKSVNSIAERRAAMSGGLSIPKINITARFRSDTVNSPWITIPPGISPAALLDSPVMISECQDQPSPTTGTFPLPPPNCGTLGMISATDHAEADKYEDLGSSFFPKPHVNLVSMPYLQSTENQVSSQMNVEHLGNVEVNHQVKAEEQMQMEFEGEAGSSKENVLKVYNRASQSEMVGSDSVVLKTETTAVETAHPGVIKQANQLEEPLNGEDTVSQQILEGDQGGSYPPAVLGRPSDDGYNWRKYGQKQVKGSEYPRSYYKCTHPNCQVKKKVERSHDGQITEIIYKGNHNHLMPQPSRRSGIGLALLPNEMSETAEDPITYVKTEEGSVWRSTQQGSKDKRSVDLATDGLERTSPTSVVTDLSDPFSIMQVKPLNTLESIDNLELSSTLACHDEDDGTSQGIMPLEDGDDDDDESESKRRKKESYPNENNSASRAVREPRVVVQTDSEVDILDDGYRWRKYGQKVVKGNPNPRSYYKCTNLGCSVRKHVERASHDLKSVITTYEGKHNHEVPVARNSSHNSSGGGSIPHTSNAQTSMTLPGSGSIPKPDVQGQDLAPQCERKLELGHEYLRPSYPGSFSCDKKFGASSFYLMKLPHLEPLAFHPFGPNSNHLGAHQAPCTANVVPEFPVSFPMELPRPDLGLASFGFNYGRPTVQTVQPLLEQQQKGSYMRFLRKPKQEQKDDTLHGSGLPINNLANASPSAYGQIMGGFPME